MQSVIVHFSWALGSSNTSGVVLQTCRDTLTHSPAFEPRSLQKAVIFRMSVLAREPQATEVRAQVLVHLQRRAGGPVAVAAVGPGRRGPSRHQERCRFGDGDVREHGPQDCHEFGLHGGVAHAFGAVRELVYHCGEDYVTAGDEARC